ncbi:hypothetical protein LXL04_004627 [Taraxacum kok-saghyz]
MKHIIELYWQSKSKTSIDNLIWGTPHIRANTPYWGKSPKLGYTSYWVLGYTPYWGKAPILGQICHIEANPPYWGKALHIGLHPILGQRSHIGVHLKLGYTPNWGTHHISMQPILGHNAILGYNSYCGKASILGYTPYSGKSPILGQSPHIGVQTPYWGTPHIGDVKFYETVFPFKMNNTHSENSDDSSLYWDPFSNDDDPSTKPTDDDPESEFDGPDHQTVEAAEATQNLYSYYAGDTDTSDSERVSEPQFERSDPFIPSISGEVNNTPPSSHSIGFNEENPGSLIGSLPFRVIRDPPGTAERSTDSPIFWGSSEDLTRLVAKGYNQREGIDYEETFAPVAKIVTIRIIITLSVNLNWNLYQLDINNAFLYGELEEDVYMTHPQGIEVIDIPNGLCLSQRKYCMELLHEFGMMGSARTRVMAACGYGQINHHEGSRGVAVEIPHSLKILNDTGSFRGRLGEMRNFVGRQSPSYDTVLKHPVKTPLEPNLVIDRNVNEVTDYLLENITNFQKLIGKLIYLTITRPDISYAIHVLSRYMHKPRKSYLDISLRLLRYLKNSPGKGVKFVKSESLKLEGFSDGDWAKCQVTRRSVSGYMVFFGNSLVSWRSKKQDTVSRSSTESEYRALGTLTCELIWILKILNDVKMSNLIPVNVYCDNESAIKLALNPVFHDKTKHFEIDEKIAKGVVKLPGIESRNQIADILIKSLMSMQHEYLVGKMGLFDPFSDDSRWWELSMLIIIEPFENKHNLK